MDRAENARRSTLVREARRSQYRTRQVAALLDQLRPHLDLVDEQWPGLTDVERVRMARIVARQQLGRSIR